MKFEIGTTDDGAPIYKDLFGRVTYGCGLNPIAYVRVSQPESDTDTH